MDFISMTEITHVTFCTNLLYEPDLIKLFREYTNVCSSGVSRSVLSKQTASKNIL